MNLLDRVEAVPSVGDPAGLAEIVPFARHLGVTLDLREGRVVTRLPHRRAHLGNPALPALHGGVVGAFLDLAATFQLWWSMESLAIPRSVSLTVDYLRSAGPLESFAAGEVTRLGRRVANVTVEAWQDDPARPVARAHAHFLISPTARRVRS